VKSEERKVKSKRSLGRRRIKVPREKVPEDWTWHDIGEYDFFKSHARLTVGAFDRRDHDLPKLLFFRAWRSKSKNNLFGEQICHLKLHWSS
jgi:hypothetical protein